MFEPGEISQQKIGGSQGLASLPSTNGLRQTGAPTWCTRLIGARIMRKILHCSKPYGRIRRRRNAPGSGSAWDRGFCPAFRNNASGNVYLSRYADGRPAPMHLVDNLPPDLAQERTPEGRISSLKASVISGYVHAGRFYTREEAAIVMAPSPGSHHLWFNWGRFVLRLAHRRA